MVIYLRREGKPDRFIPGCAQREPGISRHNLWIPGSPADAGAPE
jgi:hypothetical protein